MDAGPRAEAQRGILGAGALQPVEVADRGEDIQALIINELSQLGVTDRGTPLGIERAALYRLVQRRYPGNDAELRGLLASAAAISKGPVITLADLDALAENDDSELPPEVKETRSRARLAPRSRRR